MQISDLLAASFLLVCACTAPVGEARPDASAQKPDPAAAIASPSELAGEYRVAGVDGGEVDAPFGLVVSITDDAISFDAPCGGYGWSYTLDKGRLALAATDEPDPSCLARARIHHLVFDTASAIAAANRAERTPANGVRLSGGGRSLTLFGQ